MFLPKANYFSLNNSGFDTRAGSCVKYGHSIRGIWWLVPFPCLIRAVTIVRATSGEQGNDIMTISIQVRIQMRIRSAKIAGQTHSFNFTPRIPVSSTFQVGSIFGMAFLLTVLCLGTVKAQTLTSGALYTNTIAANEHEFVHVHGQYRRHGGVPDWTSWSGDSYFVPWHAGLRAGWRVGRRWRCPRLMH